MKVGDLVQANHTANWSVRQAKFGFVLEDAYLHDDHPVIVVRVLVAGDVKVLPVAHFEVISESR